MRGQVYNLANVTEQERLGKLQSMSTLEAKAPVNQGDWGERGTPQPQTHTLEFQWLLIHLHYDGGKILKDIYFSKGKFNHGPIIV